jgi:hypothetical protein
LHVTGADLVYSCVVMFDDATRQLLDVGGPKPFELAEFPESLYRRNFVMPSATVMRRTLLAGIGAWNTEMKYCEDLDFWLRALQVGKRFELLAGCHCLYRKNHDGATTQRESGTVEEFADIVARFPSLPGTRAARLRRYIAKAYVRAAGCHANYDPNLDTSADAGRAPRLMLHAWRYRPLRFDYLLKAVAFVLSHGLRGRGRPASVPQAQPSPVRAAA